MGPSYGRPLRRFHCNGSAECTPTPWTPPQSPNPSRLAPDLCNPSGAGLAAVLDDLKDNNPERWEMLLAEMRRWIPEYDHILFDKPQQGQKGIVLRTKKGGHRIPAKNCRRAR